MKESNGPRRGRRGVYVIAEIGVNHNGDLDLARRMVAAAAEAGADAAKFQTFRAEALVGTNAPKAEYQRRNTGVDESQFEMIRKLELSAENHFELAEQCQGLGIDFMSSPFDLDALRFLASDVNIEVIKIPSGEITNGPLLLAAARTGKSLILSSGMCSLSEVEDALKVLAFGYLHEHGAPSPEKLVESYASLEARAALRSHVTLLHCTTEYPAPFREVNLKAMLTLGNAFGLPVGLSDHTPGISVPIAAVGLGARVVEKHITLDHSLPGPDHAASLEAQDFKAMVSGIREVESALGDGIKLPLPSELKNRPIARKSLVALADLVEGEAFTERNLGAKRPGNGISPMRYWEFIGRSARRAYQAGDLIREE